MKPSENFRSFDLDSSFNFKERVSSKKATTVTVEIASASEILFVIIPNLMDQYT
jgi:hypothetical protein